MTETMNAIVIEQYGDPDVLRPARIPVPAPGPGEILIDIAAIGVNFMDTGTRSRPTIAGPLPVVPGVEGAGRIVALGDGVTGFAVGDRVAWPYGPRSYAEKIALPATSVAPVPHGIDDETAASLMMQALTAHHFVTVSHEVKPGDLTVVHAAAGGVGLMLTQLIKARGGTVIGLVSRQAKVDLAREAGADQVLVSTGDQFVDQVLRLSDGVGVHAVFDGAGGPTFSASLTVLRTHGTMVFFGPLIGDVPTIAVNELPRSTKLTFPTIRDHIKPHVQLLSAAAEIFALVERGELKVHIGQRYPLAEARQAHVDIESRRTTGKLLLQP